MERAITIEMISKPEKSEPGKTGSNNLTIRTEVIIAPIPRPKVHP